jgi:hypothetical protein
LELPYTPNLLTLSQALKLLIQLGWLSNMERIVMPNNILAFSVDLLAGSQNGEGARDVNGPRRERDRPRWRGEDEGIYLVANLSWKYFEEAESHGMVVVDSNKDRHLPPAAVEIIFVQALKSEIHSMRDIHDACGTRLTCQPPTSSKFLYQNICQAQPSTLTFRAINTSHTIVSTAIVYFHHAFRYQEKEAVSDPECAEQASRTRCLYQSF